MKSKIFTKRLNLMPAFGILLMLAFILSCQSKRYAIDSNRRQPAGNIQDREGKPASSAATISTEFAVRISAAEFTNRIYDSFGINIAPDQLPIDHKIHGFAMNTISISATELSQLWLVAKSLAGEIAANIGNYVDCSGADEICVRDFVQKYYSALYGESYNKEEAAYLTQLYSRLSASNPDKALHGVIEAMILSPRMLFQVQGAAPGGQLTGEELARKLARYFWVSVPDAQLLEAGISGSLFNTAALSMEVDRMMADQKFQRSIHGFFEQYLKIDSHESLAEVSEQEYASMQGEVMDTALYLVNSQDGAFAGLWNTELAVAGEAYIRSQYQNAIQLEPGVFRLDNMRRPGGLLSRKAFLISAAVDNPTAPIYRGLRMAESLFCRDIIAPADENISLDASTGSGGTARVTTRERLETMHSNDSCAAGCHSQFEPLGFVLGNYTVEGEYREMEYNQVIDTAVTFTIDGIERSIQDANDFANIMGQSDEAWECFLEKLAFFAMKSKVQGLSGIAGADKNIRLKEIMKAVAMSEDFKKISQ